MELKPQASGSSATSREEAIACERFVARSFYKEMRENGYTPKELLAVSIELIALVTHDLPAQ